MFCFDIKEITFDVVYDIVCDVVHDIVRDIVYQSHLLPCATDSSALPCATGSSGLNSHSVQHRVQSSNKLVLNLN